MQGLDVDEEKIYNAVRQAKRELRGGSSEVPSIIIDCAVQLSTKVQLYALIVGLLNVDEPGTAQLVLDGTFASLITALQPTSLDIHRARLLLRLIVALVPVNVVHAADALSVVRLFIDAAQSILEKAKARAQADGEEVDDDGSSWQPYTDWLMYSALISLPWGGPELAHAAGDDISALLGSVATYIERRPRQSQPGLRPFAAPVKEDDILAESDNGGSSFLQEVYSAVSQYVSEGVFEYESIPRLHTQMEVALAEGAPCALKIDPTERQVPTVPPVEFPLDAPKQVTAALLLQAFPPRGIIKLIDPQHTLGDRLPIERLIAEEYILDTMRFFEGDRVECAKRLARGLSLPYAYTPLLAETLFGQLLRLPKPPYKPIMVSALMVDVCKLLKDFPRAMSACVRECFSRMNVLDPALRIRLAEWLAFHLSNFEYIWPWGRWGHVIEAPAYDGQRHFCISVMIRLTRLSYWEKVHNSLPNEFKVLMPPKPEVEPLPTLAESDIEGSENGDVEGAWSAKLLALVRSKATVEEVESWITENALESRVDGKMGMLKVLTRCLCVAGAKSYTHMVIAFERYFGLLALLTKELGRDGEISMIETVVKVWKASSQRTAMAVDRLMSLRLLSAEAIITWVFNYSDGLRSLSDVNASEASWEILFNALEKTIARVHDSQAEVAMGSLSDDPNQSVKTTQAEYMEAKKVQDSSLLLVLTSFVQALSTWAVATAPSDSETLTEAAAIHDLMVAWLRSIMRRYYMELSGISEEIERMMSEKATPTDVRAMMVL